MSRSVHLNRYLDNSFPIPRYLSFGPAAVDVSTQTVRVMRLKRSHGRFVPDVYTEKKIDSGSDIINLPKTKNIDSPGATALIKALSDLKKELRLQYVALCLPEAETYTYKLRLPKEVEADVYTAVKYSLEDNVPLKIDDALFEYAILPSQTVSAQEETIDVVVTVFPRSIIAFYTEILHRAGLLPICFQSEPIAVANSVVKEGDYDPYLVIRLLDDRVNVSIVERNVVQYDSAILVSPKDVLANPDGEKAAELKSSLNKLLVFWFTDREYGEEHKKIQTALVVGEQAMSDEIHEYLERHLKINIESADAWANCFDIQRCVPSIDRATSLMYAPAIGLAVTLIHNA